jgi:hypothetical protein
MRLAFIPSCHSESKPKFLGLQTKVPTRRNATHPLKIHTQPSDDKLILYNLLPKGTGNLDWKRVISPSLTENCLPSKHKR